MRFFLSFENHDIFSQVDPEEREWFLRNMVASSTSNEEAWLTMVSEISTIMKGVIKEIFKAMLAERLVFEPVPEREQLFLDDWKKMEAMIFMEEINKGRGGE